MRHHDFKKIVDAQRKIAISHDLVSAGFIVVSVALFVLANYFFGFILPLWAVSMFIGAALSVAYPRAGLYALIFLTVVFERFFTLSGVVLGRSEIKLYPIDVLLGAVVIGTIMAVFGGKVRYRWDRADSLVLGFIMLAGVYLLASMALPGVSSPVAFSSAKQYGFYPVLYFVTAALISTKGHLKELGAVIFAGGIAILWFVAYGILNGQGLWSEFTPLSTEGVRTLAFTHGYYLCMVFLLGLVYLAHKRTMFSRYLAVLLVFWIIGIVGSLMRHLWIGLGLTMVMLIIFFARDNRQRLRRYAKKYAAAAVLGVVMIAYGISLFPQSPMYDAILEAGGAMGSRVTSIANGSEDESFIWRSAVWKQASQQYIQSPLFGIGLGKKVPVEIGSYHDFVEVRNLHNSFLAIVVQMGLVGGLLLLTIASILFVKAVGKGLMDIDVRIGAYASLAIMIFQIAVFMFQPYLETNLLSIFFWINLGVLRKIGE